jgi:SET domain-containing protein
MTSDRLIQGPIFVKKSPIHGYGVFAAEDLDEGQIIEDCYTLILRNDPRMYNNYFFKCEDKVGLPLGYGCIYNHADEPNVDHDYDPETRFMRFTTLRKIQRGEELFCNYGPNWFSFRKLKPKRLPWWKKTYRFLKGLPFRLALILCSLLAFIQGLTYLSS